MEDNRMYEDISLEEYEEAMGGFEEWLDEIASEVFGDIESEVITMDVYEMIDDVCGKFGFEAKETIEFCKMADAAVSDSDIDLLANRWSALMSMSIMDDDDEDEDDEYVNDEWLSDDDNYYDDYDGYGDYDECGFNPYEGCYDFDC